MELRIKHIKDLSEKSIFAVGDGTGVFAEARLSPLRHVVIGQHKINLQEGVRWLLEDYRKTPTEANMIKASNIEDALAQWGKDAYNEVFANGLTSGQYERIKVISKDANVLAWPWEVIAGEDGEGIGLKCQLVRQLDEESSEKPPKQSDTDKLNILYIIARPDGVEDVDYRALMQPLIDLSFGENEIWPVHIDLLRPPTFQQLKKILNEKPNFYHIVHFDGHGKGDAEAGGFLKFESGGESGFGAEYISADIFAKVLGEHGIPAVVLNACQSAMVDFRGVNPFASVATSLMEAGIDSVVAMGYDLSVCGAKEFVPVFYRELFRGGDISVAMVAGRKQMYLNNMRDSVVGKIKLDDWMIPVLYQQDCAAPLPNLMPATPKTASDPSEKLLGRDAEFLWLERAIIHQKQTGILIHGMRGIGKSALAKAFLQWFEHTNGFEVGIDLKVLDDFEATPANKQMLKEFLTELHGGKTKVIITSRSSEPWLTDDECSRLSLQPPQDEGLWSHCDASILGALNEITTEESAPVLRLLGLHDQFAFVNFIKDMEQTAQNDIIRLCFLALEGVGLCQPVTEGVYRLHPQLRTNLNHLHPQTDANKRGFVQVMAQLAVENAPRNLYEQYPVLSLFLGNLESALHFALELDMKRHAFGLMLCIASYAVNARDYDGAEKFLRLQVEMAKGDEEHYHIEGSAYLELGKLAEKKFTFDEAEDWYMEAVKIYKAHGDELELANAYHQLGNLASSLREHSDSEKWYAKSMLIRKGHPEHPELAGLYHALGNDAFYQKDIPKAKSHYLEAQEIFERLGDEHGLALTYHQLGLVADEEWDISAAERYFSKSLKINEAHGNELGMAATYNQLGVLSMKENDLPEAQKWFVRSLNIWMKYGDERAISNLSHQMGINAFEQEDYPTAYMWFKGALEADLSIGDRNSIATTLYQLAKVAAAQQSYADSEQWYRDAMGIWRELSDNFALATTYNDLGILMAEQEKLPAAQEWYDKALTICLENGYEHIEALVYNQMSNLTAKLKDWITTKSFLEKALPILERLGDWQNAEIIKANLANVRKQIRTGGQL